MLTQPGFSPFQSSRQALDSWIQEVLHGGAGVDGALHLFKNNVTISPATVVGDLTEADYTGYAAAVVDEDNWGISRVQPDGSIIRVQLVVFEFQPSGTTISNTVYGWYLTGSGGFLVAAGNLPNPVLLDSTASLLDIELALTMLAGAPAALIDADSNG